MADGRNWTLRRELGIPEHEKLPETLIRRIARARVGETITNPTKVGKRRIHITKKLRDKAIWTLDLMERHERRHGTYHKRKHHKRHEHKKHHKKHEHRHKTGLERMGENLARAILG